MSEQIKIKCELKQSEREICFDGAQQKLLAECREFVANRPANMQPVNAIDLKHKDCDFPEREKL